MSASPPRSTSAIQCFRAVIESLAAFGRFMVLTGLHHEYWLEKIAA
jgi:hypothetical protein